MKVQFTLLYQPAVLQVSSAAATHYNGHGFRSSQAVKGSYSYTFTQPGVYYYIAEGYAHIGEAFISP